MPPRPLSSYTQRPFHTELNSSGEYPFARRPHIAVLAMECIASWSLVESWLLNLWIALSGGNEAIAAEIFISLEGNSAKSAAIGKLVKRLDPRYQALYAAISRIAKTQQKSRDKLAHWVWGHSPQMPDALLLADPRVLAMQQSGDKTVYIYDSNCLREILVDNNKLSGYVFDFSRIVQNHHNHNDELYLTLCAEPAIREILDRRATQG